MSHRLHYWTCSNFANFIRGTKKIPSGTSEEWDSWHENANKAHPLRYWLAEEGLDIIQDIIYAPSDLIHNVRCWYKNRFITQSHALVSSSLKKGQWHDMDSRIMNCLFDELVNFIEVEKAWMEVICRDNDDKNYPERKWFREFRCPEAGLAYLEWEISLKKDENYLGTKDHPEFGQPTQQAEQAKQLLELYNWWKNIRPNRKDPMDLSGWSEYFDSRHGNDGLGFLHHPAETEEEKQYVKEILEKTSKIEEEQYDEDSQMLIKLIKLRQCMWT